MADRNPDPITGAPGAHPVGTGVGATGGAAAGAALGAVGGPAGMVVGAAIGGIAGGLAGKGVAEGMDPTVEDAYWRDNHTKASYYDRNLSYDDDYAPAYRYGYESRAKHADRKFEDIENDLSAGWDRTKGKSRLGWEKAKMATRDAWHHVEHALPGDADGDGR